MKTKTKTWNMVTLKWVTKYWSRILLNAESFKDSAHSIEEMSAVAVNFERTRYAVVTIKLRVGVGGYPRQGFREMIVEAIMSEALSNHRDFVITKQKETPATITVYLPLKKSFVEEMMAFMKLLAQTLDIRDHSNQEPFYWFSVDEKMLYQSGEVWIPYSIYYKYELGLKVTDEELEGNTFVKPIQIFTF